MKQQIRRLCADYQRVVGKPFAHFYCPILFRDEDVELCKAHVVNAAFAGARKWTVQRKDVDNFFGSMFESDFVDLQHRGKKPNNVLSDKKLSKRFHAEILVGDRLVEHYFPKGQIPDEHSLFVVEGKSGPVRLALKIPPKETFSLANANWQFRIEKDIRIAALVSVLKAAHLTLFSLLGYHYALAPGGHFIGKEVLGDFFLRNTGRPRIEVQSNAKSHFRKFAHLVRPIVGFRDDFKGTIEDRCVFLCRIGRHIWGMIVFIRAAQTMHAALVPVFDETEGASRFFEFLCSPDERVEAHFTIYKSDRWEAEKDPVTLFWPKTGILYPD